MMEKKWKIVRTEKNTPHNINWSLLCYAFSKDNTSVWLGLQSNLTQYIVSFYFRQHARHNMYECKINGAHTSHLDNLMFISYWRQMKSTLNVKVNSYNWIKEQTHVTLCTYFTRSTTQILWQLLTSGRPIWKNF